MTVFDKFTNLYSLSKTLRFELKPLPETLNLLKKTNLHGQTPIQVDEEIDNLYHKEMKPLFDELHELFITLTLEKINFNNEDLQTLEKLLIELQTLTKDRKTNQKRLDKLQGDNGEIAKIQNKLREIIGEQFVIQGERWKKKYTKTKLNDKGYKILTNAKILDVLIDLHHEKSKHIKKFQGFFTYFNGFNLNRENYYTTEAKATGVANRSINENLVIFIENRQIFNSLAQLLPKLNNYKNNFELSAYKNYLIQEGTESFNEIAGKINKEKNLFLQQENSRPENKGKKIYLPNFKKLFKQIGCRTKQQKDLVNKGVSIFPKYLEKIGLGFQIIKDSQEKYKIWQALQHVNDMYNEKLEKLKQNYQKFFMHWNEYDLNKIWFKKEAINTISARWFGGDNWSILADVLRKKGTGKIEKGEYKVTHFVSLLELKQAMDDLPLYKAENLFKDEYKKYFRATLFETILSVWQHEVESKFEEIREYQQLFREKSREAFDKNKKDKKGKSHTEVVKKLIEDGYLRLYQLTKYHNLEKKGYKDPRLTEGRFYDVLDEFWDNNEIVTYHKAFQSTITKKPYSEDKIKLNFECGTLLGGWSPDFESYAALIFNKNDKYYLGIIKGTKFNDLEAGSLYKNINSNNCIKRLIYITQKVDNKNTPRWFIRSKKNTFSPMVREGLINPKDILDIYDNKLYSKNSKNDNKNRYKKYLPKIIDYFKEGFKKHRDFKNFLFDWYDSKKYETIADFYNHTADMCYKLDWENLNFDSLRNLVKQGRLYLFQIYSKDFRLDESIGRNIYGDNFQTQKTTGQMNSHTKLFFELLKPENVKKLKLLGGGEIFFRNSGKEKRYKKDKKGKQVVDAKRYYEQKYFLHFPIKIKGKNKDLKNSFMNQKLKDNLKDIKIIGIDRGEKNLLYYSVVGSNGKMIDKGSLNIINDVNYNEKLQEKQNKRKQARLNWEEIGNIKNFKEGYLSQAVYGIYKLIIKHNAIVVLEYLNTEFKAKRLAKVEKSIYKKFELALARKLNHLILKDKEASEKGGVLNAYQLTPAIPAGDVSKFEKAHQWGTIFYVRPNYTSTTDPLTGWRKHINISNSETDKKIKEFFNPDTGIQVNYDNDKKYFKFSYENEGKVWQLFAFDGLQRFCWSRKKRKMETYNLYEEFNKLFEGLDKSKNINKQIYGKDFNWKRLVFLWNLLNQIRNTDRDRIGNENDFIQSPVWSEKHRQFFDSRKATSLDLPDNGDANGAYNIARKGIILLRRIKNCPDISKFGNDNSGKSPENGYFISDQDWDEAVSDWDKYISGN
jgi:hypothetical protein